LSHMDHGSYSSRGIEYTMDIDPAVTTATSSQI
jgi:hypothetical protein